MLIGRRQFLGFLAGAWCLEGGIRGPGKYHGVVFFDRWDNCYLLGGVHLMYISEHIKESLRAFQGKSIFVDAKRVYQAMNPGDGLIQELVVLGASTQDQARHSNTVSVTGIALRATVTRGHGGFRTEVEIQNQSPEGVEIDSHSLGFTVLRKGRLPLMCPSDGSACAMVTRISAVLAGGRGRIHDLIWETKFDESDRLPERFQLGPGETRISALLADLPNGSYEFLASYGSGVHAGAVVASNAVSFEERQR